MFPSNRFWGRCFEDSGIAEIVYGIPKALPVSLKVYDIAGRVVNTLAHGKKNPGYYKVRWDARDTPDGVYFLRLDAGDLLPQKNSSF